MEMTNEKIVEKKVYEEGKQKEEYASKGVAGTALGLGIAGTALGVLPWLFGGGRSGGIAGGGAAMLPASYFYRLGWVWRIPFGYLAGVIGIRIAYGSWVITDAMEWADKGLMAVAALAYAHWAVQRVRAAQ